MDHSTKTARYARSDQPPPPRSGGELEVTTLAIAAAASAVTAFITSQVWVNGTLVTAAISPIIVALVKESLSRPARKVKTVRLVRGGRVTGGDAPATDERPIPDSAAYEGEALTPMTVYGRDRGRFSSKRLRIAIVTGLLAFGIVVAVFTLPELVAGSSIGGGGNHRTTLFGGTPSKKKKAAQKTDAKATPTATPKPGATPTATPEETATATPTPSATTTAAPSVAATAPPTVSAAPTATP
jgi:hypothetical protein